MRTHHVTIAIMAVSVIAAIVIVATDIDTLLILAIWFVPFFGLAGLATRNTSNKR